MCTGWNQPPELFLRSQISTSPSAGWATTWVKLLLMTSSHVRPLTVHCPPSRLNSISRVRTAWFGVSFMISFSVFCLEEDAVSYTHGWLCCAAGTHSAAMTLPIEV